jgi:protein-L-isoaspartate(D-aspartate) O-methyltransferase
LEPSNPLARLLKELRSEGITDPRVLGALERVPREMFVPSECRRHAFRNMPLPIGEGQTISQPYVVALMTQALRLLGDERVLEVGTGSGYQCAILAELAGEVISIERYESLALAARRRLEELRYHNARVLVGDGSLGYPPGAPYQVIIVTAASPGVPRALSDELAEEGRLVLPEGSQETQQLVLYVKRSGRLFPHPLGAVRFVPLIGADAWQEGPGDRG